MELSKFKLLRNQVENMYFILSDLSHSFLFSHNTLINFGSLFKSNNHHIISDRWNKTTFFAMNEKKRTFGK